MAILSFRWPVPSRRMRVSSGLWRYSAWVTLSQVSAVPIAGFCGPMRRPGPAGLAPAHIAVQWSRGICQCLGSMARTRWAVDFGIPLRRAISASDSTWSRCLNAPRPYRMRRVSPGRRFSCPACNVDAVDPRMRSVHVGVQCKCRRRKVGACEVACGSRS
jgi:hypothetical protein